MKKRDNIEGQLYDACKNRVAAQVLDYFLNIHALKLKKYPDASPDSPELWMDFTREDLAVKFMVSDKTLRRAVLCLVKLGFVTIHKLRGLDRTNRYELHRSLVETLFQELPLFESTRLETVDHMDKMTGCNRSKCPDATGQNDRMQPVKMTGCIYPLSSPSISLPSPSRGFADDAEIERSTQEAEVLLVPAYEGQQRPDDAGADPEREDLVDRFRACGIAREHAEAYLGGHSRQKLQAVLNQVEQKKRRGETVQGQGGGLVVHFLRDPAAAGLEIDRQGRWLPAQVIARERKQQAARSRDRPVDVDPRRAGFLAWDALSWQEQERIRLQVEAEHPGASRGRLMELCRWEALTRRQASEQTRNDAVSVQGAH